jgi:hypothetical protein
VSRISTLVLLLIAAAVPASPQTLASARIIFGLTDTAPSVWDGSVTLDTGAVRAIQGVRFGPEDSTDYSTSWKVATRAQNQDVLENGVFITALVQPDTRWNIHTPRGDFSFTMRDLMWGEQQSFLDGAVEVTRVPPTAQLTTSDDDEDFPAVTRAGDSLWASFVRFSHSSRAQEAFTQLPKPLDSFDYLARPAGGDQVYAMRFNPANKGWSRPEPVSPKGEDTAGSAIAADGQGRVWVVWSSERNGNFDIYARANTKGQWGPEVRVTKDAGSDLCPVAVADFKGRVWIAWQGYRNNNLEILTAVQQGDSFGPEQLVSFSKASDWDPSIAAAPNGDIAIAWDTYDRGDYDVYFRRMRLTAKLEMDAPVPAAATPLFEARASIAFDSGNRLWIAYEQSTSRWGKNFGTYDSSGTPLYEERGIRVKCFDGASVFTTSSDLLNVMPGTPASPPRAPRPKANRQPLAPNPNQAKNRRPGTAVNARSAGSLNTQPRLVADASGGIYMAFRSLSRPLNSRSPVGSIWFEHVVYFDGHKWTGPVFIPRSDGAMEAGTALVALDAAHLLSVSAMDHRQSTPQALGAQGAERINSDLYAADLRLEGLPVASPVPELVKIPADTPALPDALATTERTSIDAVRSYRVNAAGQQYRILRGDFHRHTEYSIDGTRDGSLGDAYRYMIDAGGLDWGGCCDTENGEGHEYFWWREQTLADAYKLGANFLPMFAFEHLVRYPEGHRVVLFAKRGVRPVPHLQPVPLPADAAPPPGPAPDTQMLYRYLKAMGGISIPSTTATDLGTDWRDNDPAAEPAVEIYEGYRQSYESETGPRAAKTGDAIGNLRPAGYVSEALKKGYRLGFMASSDHVSTHISYANVLATEPTREAILDAIKKRHVYASTDNIIADVRSGDHLMGDEFTVTEAPKITVKLLGTAAFARVVIVKDGKEAYTATPNSREVTFDWTDPEAPTSATASYYYVRGEQTDGQIVWASPMWITRK